MELSEHDKEQLGLGAAVVCHLRQRFTNVNHKPYFDHLFTPYNVLGVLVERTCCWDMLLVCLL